ncbi:MAG TPA: UDP-3-O-(3-hydroxymyristoyl)glucosamine N-acyltransferase [Candidatus Acidoferrum sp.]|nr:UDP-3-O-(3-hydroxymyristoyl)glucosamine N-acyltransferase [Candidatus Acidoferrum sp.]
MRTARELAQHLGAKLTGDGGLQVSGVAGAASAMAEDLIYVEAERYAGEAETSAASCVVVKEGIRVPGKTNLEVKDAKLAFAKAAAILLSKETKEPGIHSSAIVSAKARVAKSASIGPFAVVEEGAEIGDGSTVGAYCFIGKGARIGQQCRLHPRVTVYAGVSIGNGTEIHAGSVLGAPGFGYVYGEGVYWKFPQVGKLEIGEDVEIGANTTVDRGSLGTTRIGRGVKVDNLVQIAHNVEIGEHSVIASQTGISGSSRLGSRVVVGGQVGIADHCEIEDGAILGAQAGIPTGKKIRRGQIVWGTPARPLVKFKEQYGWFGRLPELAERVKELEKRSSGE